MQKLSARLIWRKGALDHVPAEYRVIYTVYLPYIDALLIAFGIFGVTVGSRVVAEFTLSWFPILWALAILAAAAIALAGLAFQLARTEFVGKCVLVACMLIYVVMLFFNVSTAAQYNSTLTITIVLALLGSVLLRTLQLGSQIADKDVESSAR